MHKALSLLLFAIAASVLLLPHYEAFQQVPQQQQQQQPQVAGRYLQRQEDQQHPAPEPYSFSYTSESQGGLSTHQESGDGSGRVTGFYTIQGEDGRERRVDYVADADGYRAKVRTNEVGTRAESAADAQFDVQLPSAGQLEAAKVTYEQYKYLEETHATEREMRLARLSSRNQNANVVSPSNAQQIHQQFLARQQQQLSSTTSGQQQQQQQRDFQLQNELNQGATSGFGNDRRQLSLEKRYVAAGGQQVATGGSSSSAQYGSLNGQVTGGYGANSFQASTNQTPTVPLVGQLPASDGRQTATANSWQNFSASAGSQQYQSGTSGLSKVGIINRQPQQSGYQVESEQQQQQQIINNNGPTYGIATSTSGWQANRRRPTTLLQQQMEQQFLQQLTTDQDYPRQTSPKQPQQQQQFTVTSNGQLIAISQERPQIPQLSGQQVRPNGQQQQQQQEFSQYNQVQSNIINEQLDEQPEDEASTVPIQPAAQPKQTSALIGQQVTGSSSNFTTTQSSIGDSSSTEQELNIVNENKTQRPGDSFVTEAALQSDRGNNRLTIKEQQQQQQQQQFTGIAATQQVQEDDYPRVTEPERPLRPTTEQPLRPLPVGQLLPEAQRPGQTLVDTFSRRPVSQIVQQQLQVTAEEDEQQRRVQVEQQRVQEQRQQELKLQEERRQEELRQKLVQQQQQQQQLEEQRRVEELKLQEQQRREEQQVREQRLQEQQRLEEQKVQEQRLQEQRLQEQRLQEQRVQEQRLQEQVKQQQLQQQQRKQQQQAEEQQRQLQEQRLREQRLQEQQRLEEQQVKEQQLQEQRIQEQQQRLEEQKVQQEKRVQEQRLQEQQVREQQRQRQQQQQQQDVGLSVISSTTNTKQPDRFISGLIMRTTSTTTGRPGVAADITSSIRDVPEQTTPRYTGFYQPTTTPGAPLTTTFATSTGNTTVQRLTSSSSLGTGYNQQAELNVVGGNRQVSNGQQVFNGAIKGASQKSYGGLQSAQVSQQLSQRPYGRNVSVTLTGGVSKIRPQQVGVPVDAQQQSRPTYLLSAATTRAPYLVTSATSSVADESNVEYQNGSYNRTVITGFQTGLPEVTPSSGLVLPAQQVEAQKSWKGTKGGAASGQSRAKFWKLQQQPAQVSSAPNSLQVNNQQVVRQSSVSAADDFANSRAFGTRIVA